MYFMGNLECSGRNVKKKKSPNKLKSGIIYIYNDKGVASSFREIEKSILTFNDSLIVKTINSDEVISGDWLVGGDCFIMPGGADLPFCAKLNGIGNNQIKEFVNNGGTYIGFCAGAYYGGGFCDFDKNGPLEVQGKRELSFYPGSVRGPVLKKYIYDSEDGAEVAKISWNNQIDYNVYYNGGGYFVAYEKYESVSVLATYENTGHEGKAAIVQCDVGDGKAILMGVHPEISVDYLDSEIKHYKNRGIISDLEDGSHKDLFSLILDKCI